MEVLLKDFFPTIRTALNIFTRTRTCMLYTTDQKGFPLCLATNKTIFFSLITLSQKFAYPCELLNNTNICFSIDNSIT